MQLSLGSVGVYYWKVSVVRYVCFLVIPPRYLNYRVSLKLMLTPILNKQPQRVKQRRCSTKYCLQNNKLCTQSTLPHLAQAKLFDFALVV